MKKILLILSIFLVSCEPLMADFGLDTLALPKYTKVVKEYLPVGWWFSSFAETFGDAYPAVEEIIKTGKPKGYRIQLIWSDSHSFGDKDIPKIIALSKKYQALAVRYPDVKCEISPFCEHNVLNPDKYLDTVKQYAPNCESVNTVWKGKLSVKYKNEIHGSKSNVLNSNYNYSYDGEDSLNADIETHKAKYSKADVFYGWIPSMNGKRNMDDKTPRPDRKYWISKTELEALIYVLRNPKGKANLDSKYLFKAVSDKHSQECKGKDCKPVIIAPVKVSEIKFNLNGKSVATLPYYGVFSGGGFRYYAKDYGYKIAEKNNNQLLDVIVNNKSVGNINPAFRQNKWR